MIRTASILVGALAAAGALGASVTPANAQPARAKPAAAEPRLAPDIAQWTLENGLTVALARTKRAPVVAVQVWYRVGSKDEPADKRGTAHFFEHLMFQGSARVPPKQHTRYLQLAGGYSNAVTTEDATAFHNTVPASQFELVLALEADRMNRLVFQPKTVNAERAVLEREIDRNLRNPLYAAVVELLPRAFPGHPYGWTSGGVKSDLKSIDAESLAAFYTRFYSPNNALIVIVGDIDEATAKAAVEKHFGKLARSPDVNRPPPPPPFGAGKQTGASSNRLGFAMAGYRIPGGAHEDIQAIQLLSLILSRGESSRLYRKLVASRLAVEAGGQAIVRQQPGVFMVFGAYNDPSKAKAVEKALLAEVDRIRVNGVTAAELAAAKKHARAALGFAVQSVDGLAQQVGTSWSLTGNPSHFAGDLKRFADVTLADIKRVAKETFDPKKRLVVELPLEAPRGTR